MCVCVGGCLEEVEGESGYSSSSGHMLEDPHLEQERLGRPGQPGNQLGWEHCSSAQKPLEVLADTGLGH